MYNNYGESRYQTNTVKPKSSSSLSSIKNFFTSLFNKNDESNIQKTNTIISNSTLSRNRFESSGKLKLSTRARKFNKVLKNGKSIKNIDINDDCEDTMKDDESSINYNVNKNLNLKQNNLNKYNSQLNPNVNQNLNSQIRPKQTIPNIKKIQNPINQNISSINKGVQPQQTIKRVISNSKSDTLKTEKNSKKDEDAKSKRSYASSRSKPPIQDLSVNLFSNGGNILGNSLYGTNTNYTNNTYNSQTELTSQLGEYLEREMNSMNSLNLNSNMGKGYKYCYEFSQPGKDADGKTKTNQDSSLISINVGGMQGFNLFGVLDGHGPHGHFVSQFCKEYFINNMKNYVEILRSVRKIINAEMLYNELKRSGFSIITELYNNADLEMTKQEIFDYSLSGTTCNIVFQFNSHLVCANVGDSRGILIYDNGENNQGIFPLSVDHKPDLPGEYQRILAFGGMIDQMKDMYGSPIGPKRVFKSGSQYPGLAMSRSLGDFQGKECGVISTPQIIEFEINNSAKFMVICSDGVWEFLQNEQVRDLGNAFYILNNIVGFCQELVNISTIQWEQREAIRDDITVVSVFF